MSSAGVSFFLISNCLTISFIKPSIKQSSTAALPPGHTHSLELSRFNVAGQYCQVRLLAMPACVVCRYTGYYYVTPYCSAADVLLWTCAQMPFLDLIQSMLIRFLCKTGPDWMDHSCKVTEVCVLDICDMAWRAVRWFKNHRIINSIINEPLSWLDTDKMWSRHGWQWWYLLCSLQLPCVYR